MRERRAIKAVNEEMEKLRVQQHPDKTFIGRIARGFDFLGYSFSPLGLAVAKTTVEKMVVKVARLYEQGASKQRIESYLKHWWRWVRSGVDGVWAGDGGPDGPSLSGIWPVGHSLFRTSRDDGLLY